MRRWFFVGARPPGGGRRAWAWRSSGGPPPGGPRRGGPRRGGLRLFWTLLALASLLVLAAGVWLLRRPSADSAAARVTAAAALRALDLDAPMRLLAGEPFSVTVTASPPLSGTEILLAAQGTSGLLALSLPLRDGVAAFSIPPGWSQAAGVATLRAIGGGVAESQAITIEPRAAANPLFVSTGPASIPIGGEPPMLVAIPLDAFGNGAPDGAAVVVRTQPPAPPTGSVPAESVQVLTRNLLAATRLATHSLAGLLAASASSEGAHSLSQSVRLMPADVEDVEVQVTPPRAPAAGSTGVALQTNLLADAHGNLLPDGVAVFFLAESADGSRRSLPAVTVSGRARATLSAPLFASSVAVRALVGAAASAPVTVTFTAPAPVAPFDLAATPTEEGVTLRAGPLLTDLGALAPDGIGVEFTVTDPFGGRSIWEAATHYGYAEITLHASSLPAGAFHVAAAVNAQAGTGQAGTGQAGAGRGETTFLLAEAGLPAPESGPESGPETGPESGP